MSYNYLHDYMTYATGNECPDMFHVWGGFVTLSAAVGRKVWLPFEDEAKFPNIYVLYVGDAGNGKSHAMRKAKRLLAALDLPYSGSLETPPGMWRYMSGNPKADPPIPAPDAVKRIVQWPDGKFRDTHQMTIVANEFINFISLDQQGWVSALNDIYDEDNYHYRTKNMGEDSLLGPYIVMVGALTTEVSADLQKARIISTGLARRTIFQYGQRMFHNPHPWPSFTPEQRAARGRCIDYLKIVNAATTAGSFNWPPAVDAWWDAWYRPHLALVPTRSPSVRSWYATKADQMLKLAMLASLSENVELKLDVKHFELAHEYLTVLEDDLPKIFGGVGRNELAGIIVKMIEFLEYLPEPMAMVRFRREFFNQCKPPLELEQCITHLLETGAAKRWTGMIKEHATHLDIISVPKTLNAWLIQQGQVPPPDVDEGQLPPPPTTPPE